jgi:hypothetical protein
MKEFDFSGIEITEADITDKMVHEECIAYLQGRVEKSKYLRENITVAETEALHEWISKLSLDEALELIFEAKKKAGPGMIKKAASAVTGAAKGTAKAVSGAAKGTAKAVSGAAKATKTSVVAAGKDLRHPVKTWKKTPTGAKYAFRAGATIGAGYALGAGATIGAGLAARALYKKYIERCARACKGASDKQDCIAKCKVAAKAAASSAATA